MYQMAKIGTEKSGKLIKLMLFPKIAKIYNNDASKQKRNNMNVNKISILGCCIYLFCSLVAAEDSEISLLPNCHTFYAGREQIFTVVTKGLNNKRLSWNIRYAGRTLAAGQRIIPENVKGT